MKPFEYIRPESLEDVCSVLAEYGSDAAIIAGGTDLLIELRRNAAKVPKVVVDVAGISELHGITQSNNILSVKPLTTHTALVRSNLLQRTAHCISSAALTVGSPQIRNRGTIGGNIMNAAPCADTVPPLIALGAAVVLQSKNGSRTMNLDELFIKPYKTKANSEELLTEITFPSLPANSRSAFIKLGRRNAVSISRLSVAVILSFADSEKIADARIVPGSAFPTWRRVTSAEKMLIGEKPSEKLFAEVGKEVSAEMIRETGRRWSTEYKEPVIAVLVRRALEQCAFGTEQLTAEDTGSTSRFTKRTRKQSVAKFVSITTTINGRKYALNVRTNQTLLDFLRDELGFTGTKCGCEIGECGACTVLLDGQAVNSCLVLAAQIDGREVVTIEGLKQNGNLYPLQESFMDHDAAHCGFCTPGVLMSAKALLDENPQPTETEIRTAISGNLCRCTGYVQIVEAIKDVIEK